MSDILKQKCHFICISGGDWWLKITDINQLADYTEINSKTVGSIIGDFILGLEPTTERARKLIEFMKAVGKSPLEFSNYYNLLIAETMAKSFHEKNVIFINQDGGFNSDIQDSEIEQSLHREKFLFPCFTVEDIRIRQWTDKQSYKKGLHYYAYIGDLNIRDGDKIKWDDYDSAYNFALNYVNKE